MQNDGADAQKGINSKVSAGSAQERFYGYIRKKGGCRNG